MSANISGFVMRAGSDNPWWRTDGKGLILITEEMLPTATDTEEQRQNKIHAIADKAGMGWKAIKKALSINIANEGDEPMYVDLSSDYALVRDDTYAALGIFKKANAEHEGYYQANDPTAVLETVFDFIEVAANEQGLIFETAGSLSGGKKVWAQAAIPGEYNIAGDAHKRFVSFLDSFDGTTCTTGQAGTTRVVCENTFQMSLGEKAPRVKLNHSREFTGKRKDMFIADLKAIMAQHEQYKVAAELLAKTKFSKDQAVSYLTKLLFVPEEKEVKAANGETFMMLTEPSTKTKNNIERLLLDYDATVQEGTDKDTLWTVFNAVTRYGTHNMGIKQRGGKSEEAARIESGVIGAAQNLKANAFADLMKIAEAA
jgi:phage/plasmid-like protein (TIGR03299 family)